jgi:CRP/FNR family transcriptional regulator
MSQRATAVRDQRSQEAVPGPVACQSCDLQEICGIIDRARDRLPESRLRPVRAGEVLYRAGAQADFIYAARKGVLKSVGNAGDGQACLLAVHVPGEALGTEALNAQAYSNDVIAITPVICCELPLAIFADHNLHRTPELNRALTQLRARLSAPLGDLSDGPLPRRVKAFFAALGYRLAVRGFDPDRFTLNVTREEIGSLFDRGLHSVGHALRRLEREGVIRIGRKHVSLRYRH